jgi:hypothetical protein
MKFEQARMKRKYAKSIGQSTCLMGVDGNQWQMPVAYQEKHNTKKKSEQLVVTKNVVQNVSTYGHNGKTWVES